MSELTFSQAQEYAKKFYTFIIDRPIEGQQEVPKGYDPQIILMKLRGSEV